MNEQELVDSSFKEKPCHSLLGEKIFYLAKTCCRIKEAGVAGSIAECGVYRGGSARLMATAFPDRKVYLFDSFCGFVQDDSIEVGFKKGHFADTSLDFIKEYLNDRPNCLFYQGWLPESAKEVDDKFCLIHMDMDHYESTIKSLNLFWPKLVEGGAIIFDDWEDDCCPGIKMAIGEFFSNKQELTIRGKQCVVFK